MDFKYEEEHVARRGGHGVDYGADGRVLIVHGSTSLVWREGHTGRKGRGTRVYYPAHLQVLNPKAGSSLPWHDIFKGGRLTLARIDEHMETIREAMDLPMLRINDIKLGQTLVVEKP